MGDKTHFEIGDKVRNIQNGEVGNILGKDIEGYWIINGYPNCNSNNRRIWYVGIMEKVEDEKMEKELGIKLVRKEVDKVTHLENIIKKGGMVVSMVSEIHKLYTEPQQGELDYIEIPYHISGISGYYNDGESLKVVDCIRISKDLYEQIKKAVESDGV